MFSDYNGQNFTECMDEIRDAHGDGRTLDKVVEVLEDFGDEYEDLKKELLNALWVM